VRCMLREARHAVCMWPRNSQILLKIDSVTIDTKRWARKDLRALQDFRYQALVTSRCGREGSGSRGLLLLTIPPEVENEFCTAITGAEEVVNASKQSIVRGR